MQRDREERPRPFAILSWGGSGSYWLAKVLNAHPEIFCVHHLKWHLEHVLGLGPGLEDDVRYLRLIRSQGEAYRLAGDVHGVRGDSLPALREAFGPRFRCASLVRHPVPRVRSSWAHAERLGFERYGIDADALRAPLDPALRKRLDSDEQLFFVHLLNLVNFIGSEPEPIVRLEDLSASPAAVAQLVDHLSDGELDFPPALLAGSLEERVNLHVDEGAPREPRAAFAALPVWQREAFSALLAPEARARHEALGYDLSFV